MNYYGLLCDLVHKLTFVRLNCIILLTSTMYKLLGLSSPKQKYTLDVLYITNKLVLN